MKSLQPSNSPSAPLGHPPLNQQTSHVTRLSGDVDVVLFSQEVVPERRHVRQGLCGREVEEWKGGGCWLECSMGFVAPAKRRCSSHSL